MHEYRPFDVVKEVVWNLFVYVLYYIYCFVMLLLVHFMLYRFIKSMQWTVRDIAVCAVCGNVDYGSAYWRAYQEKKQALNKRQGMKFVPLPIFLSNLPKKSSITS